jgi:hypothetical protein
MTTHRLKTKLTETGKLNLDNLPFKQGDEIEIIMIETNSSKLEEKQTVWEAYLQSKIEREEVYKRLADS